MKLIDKDALVAKIDKFMYGANLEADIAYTGECFNEEVANAKYKLCKQIKDEINSLEVKEVKLTWKDMRQIVAISDKMLIQKGNLDDKGFYEAVLEQFNKAQKGE